MTHKIAARLLSVFFLIMALLGTGVLAAHDEDEEDRMEGNGWSTHVGDGEAWLGVRLTDISPETARQMKLPGEYGVVITEVEDGSPAAKAGLVANDVILEFAGERLRSARQLQRLVGETPPGRAVNLQISRSGQTRNLSVVLDARRDGFRIPSINIPEIEIPDYFGLPFPTGGARLGISGDKLTPQLAEYFGVKQGKGVLVREVVAGSPAEKAGLKAGDCIVRVGATEVGSVMALQAPLRASQKRSTMLP